jgi:hypothetical protein
MAVPLPKIAVLRLEVEVDSEPIRGVLVAANGHTTPFSGWMDLAARREAARELAR